MTKRAPAPTARRRRRRAYRPGAPSRKRSQEKKAPRPVENINRAVAANAVMLVIALIALYWLLEHGF